MSASDDPLAGIPWSQLTEFEQQAYGAASLAYGVAWHHGDADNMPVAEEFKRVIGAMIAGQHALRQSAEQMRRDKPQSPVTSFERGRHRGTLDR